MLVSSRLDSGVVNTSQLGLSVKPNNVTKNVTSWFIRKVAKNKNSLLFTE